MKKLRYIFFIFGIFLFIYVMSHVGLAEVLQLLKRFGWYFPLVALAYLAVYWIDSLAWSHVFRRSSSVPVRVSTLMTVRIAADAVTNTVPLGQLGGEPVKAYLLKRKGIPLSFALASQVVDKTTLVLSQVLYVLLGLVILAFGWDLSRSFRSALLWMFGGGLAAILLFLYFQQKGIFSRLVCVLMRFKIMKDYFETKIEKIQQLDENIVLFYKEQKRDFFLALFLYFVGWLVGVMEVYIIMLGLGIPGGIALAIVIDSVHQLVRSFSFFIPYGLGTQEGANALVFSAFGIGAVFGVSLTLIRRVRELIWAVIGYIFIYSYHVPLKKESG